MATVEAPGRPCPARALRLGGLEVLRTEDVSDALRLVYRHTLAAAVIEVGDPSLDGWRILERIRQVSELPVLIMSSAASELEHLRALRAGADAYIGRTFEDSLLVARTEALMRRWPPAGRRSELYGDGVVEVDVRAAEARLDGEPLELRPLEFRLLAALISHPGQVLSAPRLLELAWGDATLPRTRVKTYVGYLRSRFRERGLAPPIETVRGFGYRYRPARD